MAEIETYHTQKVEDFASLAKEHLDGEIELYEQVSDDIKEPINFSFSKPRLTFYDPFSHCTPRPCTQFPPSLFFLIWIEPTQRGVFALPRTPHRDVTY